MFCIIVEYGLSLFLPICASIPIGVRRMEDVKRIDDANDVEVETCNSNCKW